MFWVLCKAGKLNDAEELFDQTETTRVVPCAYAYNTILMAFATGGYAAVERITQCEREMCPWTISKYFCD
jgi:pentatricopeptide repeat protein